MVKKRKPRALTRDIRQTGSSNMARDRKLKALAPGKRRSKKGNIYYENRRNRSDVKGRDTPIRLKKRKVASQLQMEKNNRLMLKMDRDRRRKISLRETREPNRGLRRHDLLPMPIRRILPKLYSQDGKKDPMVYLKLFSPYSQYTFYVTEFDGKDTLYGYVSNGQGSEWGYSSFMELAKASRGRLPLIERDKFFSPKRASRIKDIKRLRR